MPEKMAYAVNKDLNHRESAFEDFKKNTGLIDRMFADSITEKESQKINNLPFFIYGYEKGSLKFWNTNTVIAGANDSATDKPFVVRNEKGVFIEQQIPGKYGINRKLIVLFPVLISYPLENSYLRSHFAASPYIPVSTKVVPVSNTRNLYPVSIGKQSVCSLDFSTADIQKWTPDGLFVTMLICAFLASVWWLQLMTIYLTRNRSRSAGFLTTLFIIAGFRVLLYVFGLPFNLDSLNFFSPSLYASSVYLSSLGDLFINTLLVLWLVIFLIRHTPYRTYFDRLKNDNLRFSVAVVLSIVLALYVYLFINIIRGLVLDSSIPFDVSHFYSINAYTFLGLLVIGSITGLSCIIIHLFNVQLDTLIKRKTIKYILLAVVGAVLILVTGIYKSHASYQDALDRYFYWLLLAWLLVFIRLLDWPRLKLVSDILEPRMIFWAAFICLFSTNVLHYFNQVKERNTRATFVRLRLAPHNDDLMEFTFHNNAKKIERDKTLKAFFYKPSPSTRKSIDQYLDSRYLTGPTINKYQSRVYLFNAAGNALHNKDTTDLKSLRTEKEQSSSTSSSYLFYNEDIHDRPTYLSYIPVYNDTINKVIGYVVISFGLKKQATETVSLELLQPATKTNTANDNEYAYAIYVNDTLRSQTSDYPFQSYLDNDSLGKDQDMAFYTNKNVSELYFRLDERRTAVVVHLHSLFIELTTLFSYLFVIQVMLATIILSYQTYLSWFSSTGSKARLVRFTLRRRIHFSMLAVVFISFVIIGFVTILFFTTQYKNSNSDKLQSSLQVARQSIQDVIKQRDAGRSDVVFDSVCRSNSFKSVVTTLANNQKIDINIFNNRGMLLNTSEDDIYNKGLLSQMMKPDAYFQLNDMDRSILVHSESVAGLSYISAYQPLRDDEGRTLGYINVPFFSSEKELNFQISNIVVTLINLYAFIFLVSSVLAVFITRWITRSFSVIIQQFSKLNLQRNERISWPYDDEVGLLVSEYNKMVNKVEENAALLAQSERETAWREMARQVAHEIKNPLTPMKLNIQYLQQAMRNGNANIKELTDKVAYSIIEQIDNLSYIASEFSNFAKMPEARPEELELGPLLNKAVELYINDDRAVVSIKGSPERLFVMSDRSQLLRVFTNLLENAKQAIETGKNGTIDVVVAKENGTALITITDNGEGITDDVAKKLFQPYFTTKSSGTGLGLAMTRKIIEFWKGTIWFETKVGEGTTFFIRLPLINTEKPA